MKLLLTQITKVIVLTGGFCLASFSLAMMAWATGDTPKTLEECLQAAEQADGRITPQATRTCAFNFSQDGKYYEMGRDGHFIEVAGVINREGRLEEGTTVPDTSHLETSL